MNNDKWAAETTSSGSEFQILSTRTAKKCCLQLTFESGKNNLNEWPRVLELQINVKKLSGDNKTRRRMILNKELSLHVIDEAPDGRVPVKHSARRTVTSEIPVVA